MSLQPADLACFAKLGIPPDLLAEAHVQRVSDREARDAFGIQYSGDKTGIVFPYYDVRNRRVTARLRRDNPEVDTDGKPQNKYICAWGDRRHLYFPPGFTDTVKESSEVGIVAVEAEKSALAGTAWARRTGARLVFFALGGCWGWRGRVGKTESSNGTRVDVKGVLTDLDVCDGRKVYILLDSNVAAQPKVLAAERAFVAELRKRRCDVFTCRIPVLDGVNGPDDLIAVAGDDEMADVIASAQSNDRRAHEDTGSFIVDTMQVQQQFTDIYGATLRYTAESGRWYRWTGQRYEHADTCDVFELARAVCREVSLRPENARSRSWIASPACVAGVEKLSRGRTEHRISVAQWDPNPWMLNTRGGIVDLRTGVIRPGRPDDYCSKITAVAPLPGPYHPESCPLWLNFLKRATQGDKGLEDFLQRMAGYCLTGITREHALFFFFGTGGNGKGTYMNATSGAMGDYAQTAAMSTLMATDTERHPTELAALQGARMVLMSEPEEGGRWAEAKVKALTGGDKVSARFMRQNFFEFWPQFKPVIAGNHKPGLRTPDVAMRRRMNLILFTATITPEEKDDKLGDKLRLEWPAILSWMIAGCLEWQRSGLCPPKVVTDATDEYMAGEDRLGRWTDERCFGDRTSWVAVKDLFANFCNWSEESGERAGSLQKFSVALEGRGYAKERRGFIRGFVGLGLHV